MVVKKRLIKENPGNVYTEDINSHQWKISGGEDNKVNITQEFNLIIFLIVNDGGLLNSSNSNDYTFCSFIFDKNYFHTFGIKNK